MSKFELIHDILECNPSAEYEFLTEFDEPALKRYLSHLRFTMQPRNGRDLWVRTPETSATITRGRLRR